ncbi:MAG: Cna domain protein, partial [Verrucomicrobiaceae bacterium]|nr:Cna domain protein [Verrucomicrobiaceae bacterium]
MRFLWLVTLIFLGGCVVASAQSTSVLEWNFGSSSYSAAANVKHAAVSNTTVNLSGQGITASQSGTSGNYYMAGGSWVNTATSMSSGRASLSPLSAAKEFYTTFTLGNTVAGDWSTIAVQLDYLRTSTSPTKIQASLTWLEGGTYRTKYSSILSLSGTAWTTLSMPLSTFYPTSPTTAPPLSSTTFLLEIQAYTVSTSPNSLSIDNVKLLVNSLSNTNYGDYSAFTSASSTANSTLRIGAAVAAQVTGTSNTTASTDTSDDGVTVPSSITQGVLSSVTATVTNTSGTNGYLNIWVDYNANGTSDTGEQILTDQVVTTGTSGSSILVPFTPPIAATVGTVGVRARLTSTVSPGIAGADGVGEVEDYVTTVTAATYDYGDSSLIATNASSVVNSRLTLGATVDAEATPTTNATATGDDGINVDDENGITAPSVLYKGVSTSIVVTVNNTSGAAAYLNAWIDFNRNGLLTDSGEQIATNISIANGTTAGTQTITFTTPAGASTGNATIRLRLTSTASPGPTGSSGGSGEVEDYVTPISGQNVITVGNLIWNDANDNGVMDSESGISGVTVDLMDPGDDNAIGGSGANADTVVATTTSNATGTYSFANQSPGTYYLRVIPTATYPIPSSSFAGDTAIDNKNKGTQPGGALTPIYGPIFTLALNSEPGVYGTTNAENTMDFGLHLDGTSLTGNQLTNNSFESGTFTSDGTLAGSPRRSSSSSMPTGWTDYQPPSYWVDATAAGGSIDGNKLIFQPGNTSEPCFS